ncbi:MAG: 4-oxalocrotonate tautomerase [Myxococcaceae bacterium]|nr:4-oxalocrotonate tautomerase [Myxococcaceae bacterium]MEA2752017.1 hypothetical protein [Myxococcales bacterium]
MPQPDPPSPTFAGESEFQFHVTVVPRAIPDDAPARRSSYAFFASFRSCGVDRHLAEDPHTARTWVLLTEAAEDGWGIAGTAFGREALATLAKRAQEEKAK